MKIFSQIAFGLTTIALAACGTGTPAGDSGNDVTSTDASMADGSDGGACIGQTPPAGSSYCTMAGCLFRPVSFPSCTAAGDMYDYYGADNCHVTATVIVISAGWCVPCMQEAPMIEQQITEGYAPRGVRVINVYAQNPDGTTPTLNHCQGWQTGAERSPSQPALTSHVVMDPAGLTQAYLPTMGQGFPTSIVIDNTGTITDLIVGGDLGRVTSDLDGILAGLGR